ncbi:MAG: hypothetical protein ACQETP_11260 [Bacteroidota bacterium]
MLGVGIEPLHAQDRNTLDGCPAEVERNRYRIEQFLTAEKWAEERAELGLPEGTGQIQLLTDQINPDVCQRLGEGSYVSDWLDRTFYSVGSYYVKVSSYKPINERPNPDELAPVDASMIFVTLGDDKYELHGIYGGSLVLDSAPE